MSYNSKTKANRKLFLWHKVNKEKALANQKKITSLPDTKSEVNITIN
jgi:hypothetical protein